MPVSFPSNPSVNDTFESNGKTWQWNGTAWILVTIPQTIANASITEAKLGTGAVTADKIGALAVTSGKIDSNAVTSGKIASSAVTEAKINDGAVTQNKMASGLSGITVTTTALRSTVVPTPFTGQFVFLTDTSSLQRWNGSAWVGAATTVPTEAPTSLTLDSVTGTTAVISFTPGNDGGSTITNYQYALSTNGGVTYGSYQALSPADGSSPITISSLTEGTTYSIKLKPVNALGTGSAESAALSFTTLNFPSVPTNLAVSGASTLNDTTITFTPGNDGGASITNYKYALSTNGGSTYGAYTALSPADPSSPITITGLSDNTVYHVKLKAVNSVGDSVSESAAISFQTLAAAPTGLSAVPFDTSTSISFTQGTGGGATITNYKVALSTNGGSTYGAYAAISPADSTSPITVSGLTVNQAYFAKIRAVTATGDGAESSAVSFTTQALIPSTVEWLVVAGGGGGGTSRAGGGGAGGYRSGVSGESSGGGASAQPAISVGSGVTYTITVGGGGGASAKGSNSSISGSNITTITSTGGGRGNGVAGSGGADGSGGSGGGGRGEAGATDGNGGTANEGYAGGAGTGNCTTGKGAGGGGAGGVGAGAGANAGNGGSGVSSSISGSSVTRAGGGGGGIDGNASGSAGGASGGGGAGGKGDGSGNAGSANTGGGGGGGGGFCGGYNVGGSAGGSGVVIIRYPSNNKTATTLTGGSLNTTGGYHIYTFNSSGTIGWS